MFKWFLQRRKSARCPDREVTTLDAVADGERVHIECLRGDITACQRLREMGFCENAQIEKVTDNGAVICRVCDSKIIISQGLARNIFVGPLSNQEKKDMSATPNRIVPLSRLTEGESGRIHDFTEENDTCARLEEMGVTPGERVEVVRYAPLGDPIEIRIRGYLLSLRKEEAELIQVVSDKR